MRDDLQEVATHHHDCADNLRKLYLENPTKHKQLLFCAIGNLIFNVKLWLLPNEAFVW